MPAFRRLRMASLVSLSTLGLPGPLDTSNTYRRPLGPTLNGTIASDTSQLAMDPRLRLDLLGSQFGGVRVQFGDERREDTEVATPHRLNNVSAV
jgi:uncharacterized heparinase superfamily protein